MCGGEGRLCVWVHVVVSVYGSVVCSMHGCVLLSILANHCCIRLFCFAAPLSSDLPSVPSSSSSQTGATTADKGPSPEMEALPTTQQGMLHAVSLHTRVHLTVYRVWEVCLCVIVCLCVGRADPSPSLN